MKKFLSLLIALCVMLVPTSTAFAAPGDATILRRGEGDFDGGVNGMAYIDGTLYIMTYDGIFTFGAGDAKAVRHAWDEDSFVKKGEASNLDRRVIFTDGERLYVVCNETEWIAGEDEDDSGSNEVLGFDIRTLTLQADGTFAAEVFLELDYEDEMIEEYDDYAYVRQMDYPFYKDGALYFMTYAEDGQVMMMCDLEDGSFTRMDIELSENEEYVNSVGPYKDGLLLVQSSIWSREGNTVNFYAYDPSEEELEKLFVLPTIGYSYPSNAFYSEKFDTLYYVMNGELFTIAGMDVANNQSVAEMPVESYNSLLPVLTDEGYFICGGYESVVRRNTDPTLRAEKRLVVQNRYSESVQNAYHAFTNVHGDVEVVMVQSVEDIVQAMMNQSKSVDIYHAYVTDATYSAVLGRGYMAELTGSEKISDFVSRMYPQLRDFCMKDGEVVAVPIEIYMNSRGYNPEAFKKAGLTEDDVPKTWVEFFEALPRLYAHLEDYPEVKLFEPYYSRQNLRYEFFSSMLQDYMTYMAQPGNEFKLDTPLFRSLLEAFEAIDFAGLDLPEDEDLENVRGYSYEPQNILFSSYSDISPRTWALESESKPMLLALSEEVDPIIITQLSVLFVNPFSQNRASAIEFMESVVDNLDGVMKIQMLPDFNERIKDRYYETQLESYDQMIADAKKALERASDDEKAAAQQTLTEYEGYKKEYEEKHMWEANEASIAYYRGFAEKMMVQPYLGIGNDNAEEFYKTTQQYVDGLIDGDAFIKNIDGKLQMMMAEGQ